MNLYQRVKDILLQPRQAWLRIAHEPGGIASIYRDYLLYLAAIPALASFVGLTLVGFKIRLSSGPTTVRIALFPGVVQMVAGYLLSLVMVFAVAALINGLAPVFGGSRNAVAAFKLVAYGSTAGYVGGIFGLVPSLAILGLIAALYSIYLVYTGLPVLMRCPPDQTLGYTAVVVMAGIAVDLAFGAVTRLAMGLANGDANHVAIVALPTDGWLR